MDKNLNLKQLGGNLVPVGHWDGGFTDRSAATAASLLEPQYNQVAI